MLHLYELRHISTCLIYCTCEQTYTKAQKRGRAHPNHWTVSFYSVQTFVCAFLCAPQSFNPISLYGQIIQTKLQVIHILTINLDKTVSFRNPASNRYSLLACVLQWHCCLCTLTPLLVASLFLYQLTQDGKQNHLFVQNGEQQEMQYQSTVYWLICVMKCCKMLFLHRFWSKAGSV